MPANPFPFDSTQTVASCLARSTRPQAVDSCLHSGDWLSVTSSRFSLSSELLKFLGLFAVLNCWHCFTCSASASPTSTRLLPAPAHVRLGHPSGGGLCSCCWRWLLSISLDDGGRADRRTSGQRSAGSLRVACQLADSGIDLMLFCAHSSHRWSPANNRERETEGDTHLIGPTLAVFIHAFCSSTFCWPETF